MESTSLNLMPAGVADWPDLLALENSCYTSIDVFRPRRLRYLLRSGTCRVLMLRDESGILVGSVIGLIRRFRAPSGRIYKITVNPAFQGRGIGSRLVHEIEQVFRLLGMEGCYAEVRVSNNASQILFSRNGYQLLNRLPGYYDDGEDGLKFWKSFK